MTGMKDNREHTSKRIKLVVLESRVLANDISWSKGLALA